MSGETPIDRTLIIKTAHELFYFPACPSSSALFIPSIIKYVPIANSTSIINGAYF